jgi:hypothetical protein
MIKKTTITYDIEEYDDNTVSKVIEYKKYNKVSDTEENIFTYKNIMKINSLGEQYVNNETFNKLNKVKEVKEVREVRQEAIEDTRQDTIYETVGYSINNNSWKIIELKNHVLSDEYEKKYDNIKLDITCDMIDKSADVKYINNK